MRTHTFPFVIGLSGLLGVFWINACSVDTNGAAPEPSDAAADSAVTDGSGDSTVPKEDVVAPLEAAADAPHETSTLDGGHAPDAAGCDPSNCAGACCGDECVDRSCAGCNMGTLFCPFSTTVPNSNGQCISSCSTCSVVATDGGVPCFSCANGSPVGTCAATIDQCPTDTNRGACPCSSGDAGELSGIDAGMRGK